MSNTPISNLTRPKPLSCICGSLVAGALAFALYRLTTLIAQSFAANPIHSHNPTALNISVAVRTLVVGMSALGTAVFGIVALGLMALGIQLLWQRVSGQPPDASS